MSGRSFFSWLIGTNYTVTLRLSNAIRWGCAPAGQLSPASSMPFNLTQNGRAPFWVDLCKLLPQILGFLNTKTLKVSARHRWVYNSNGTFLISEDSAVSLIMSPWNHDISVVWVAGHGFLCFSIRPCMNGHSVLVFRNFHHLIPAVSG